MKGYIYQINIGDNLYVGSTEYIDNREFKHNDTYKYKSRHYDLYNCCREHNIEYIKLNLLDTVEIENDIELKLVEQSYIDKLKPNLNMRKAIRTEEDKKEYNRQNSIRMNIRHNEKYKQNKRENYNLNKEKINEGRKLNKVNCPICNKEMRKDGLQRHIKNIHKK